MVPICGVCHVTDSKYTCPACGMKYCSLACYKDHKASHANDDPDSVGNTKQKSPPKRDRPGTTQRVPKIDFTGFETDKDFLRLVARYPMLRIQLQAVYGLTLEPGPDEARSWNRHPLPGVAQSYHSQRGSRGRGRGRGTGNHRGGAYRMDPAPEERQHGLWNQEKGDKEALSVIKKIREAGSDHDDASEGMREFVELCQIKFGN